MLPGTRLVWLHIHIDNNPGQSLTPPIPHPSPKALFFQAPLGGAKILNVNQSNQLGCDVKGLGGLNRMRDSSKSPLLPIQLETITKV